MELALLCEWAIDNVGDRDPMESLIPNPADDLMELELLYDPEQCSTPVFVPTAPSYSFDIDTIDLSMYGPCNETLNDEGLDPYNPECNHCNRYVSINHICPLNSVIAISSDEEEEEEDEDKDDDEIDYMDDDDGDDDDGDDYDDDDDDYDEYKIVIPAEYNDSSIDPDDVFPVF